MSERKKSWKEIDQMRDGRNGQTKGSARGPKQDARSQKSYRAALDRAFSSGAIGELVKEKAEESGEVVDDSLLKLTRAIIDAEGRLSITKATDAYYDAAAGLPNDTDALAKVVQHKNPTRQIQAMEKLSERLDEHPPKRTRELIGSLKLVRDTADDKEMEDLASNLLDRLE